jgi:hypothetical protein
MTNLLRAITTFSIALLLVGCASKTIKSDSAPVQDSVKKSMTAEAVRVEPVKADDYKNYIFERTVKIRVANDPSSEILYQIDEGSKISAFIKYMNNGWNYFKNKTGVEGFFFGKSAKEVSK